MDEDNDDGLGGRTRDRLERVAHSAYGTRLAKLNADQLELAPLPFAIRDALQEMLRTDGPSPRRRMRGFVDKLLRAASDEEIAAIKKYLKNLPDPDELAESKLATGLERLVEGGDEAVQELVADRPWLDAQRLRNLLRGYKRDPKVGGRAERMLREALAETGPS